MGIDARPPLPAATESWTDNGNETGNLTTSDLATDVSRRTDRTSYSIPEDGSPIIVPLKSKHSGKGKAADQSQTSLLIEYFEASKTGGKSSSRPSVRVRVTPHAKKGSNSDAVEVTEAGTKRTLSYSRTISLHPKSGTRAAEVDEPSGIHQSPIETDPLGPSEASSINRHIEPTSDISSMPADSMLEAPVTLGEPQQDVARENEAEAAEPKDTLRTPSQRQKSLSRERITQKVIERLGQEQTEKSRTAKTSDRGLSQDDAENVKKSARRRSSKSTGSERISGSADSSLLSARGHGSNVSGISRSSINNPKLLQTVEDAIRRLILPEIETMKREQSIHYNRERFDRGGRALRDYSPTGDRYSRDAPERRVTKSSSEPRLKPKLVLNRDENNPGTTLSGDSVRHKSRKSSRHSASSSRRDSLGSSRHDDRSYRRKTGDRSFTKEAIAGVAGAIAGGALTAAALKQHDSTSSRDLNESSDKHERRRKSRSRSNSIATTEGDEYIRQIPPMPMRSTAHDSDLTRDSILSADTERPASRDAQGTHTPIRDVGRSSPRVVRSRESSKTPGGSRKGSASRDVRSPAISALYSSRSDRSIGSKSREAAVAAAGLAAGAAAATAYHKHSDSQAERETTASPVQSAASLRDSPIAKRDVSFTSSGEPSPLLARNQQGQSPIEASRQLDLEMRNIEYHFDDVDESKDHNLESWYDEQQQLNDEYRQSIESEAQFAGDLDMKTTEVTEGGNRFDLNSDPQRIKDIGSNPEYVRIPPVVESAVASIVAPSSMVSLGSDQQRSFLDSPTGENPNPMQSNRDVGVLYNRENNRSAERWTALKNQARDISGQGILDTAQDLSPQQSVAESLKSDGAPEMSASAVPVAGDPIPELEHVDDATDLTTNPSVKDRESIVSDQLGDPYEDRGHWPRDVTPSDKRAGYIGPLNRDSSAYTAGQASLFGAAAGLGLVSLTTAKEMNQRDIPASATRDIDTTYPAPAVADESIDMYKAPVGQPTPQNLKDEGYISGQPQSPPTQPKLSSFTKPPQLFDEADLANDRDLEPDPFINTKRDKYVSGNSHGMSSPFYDAATGRGINNIQSKDVVALMDHLTVRDGQRNARDTEILVTLVRSAAEMRNNFDDLKRAIAEQQMNSVRVDTGGSSRNVSAPRTNTSSRYRDAITAESASTKKKNIFQRALKGLGSRNSDDLTKIEDMLMHLLDEVEDLKLSQGFVGASTAEPKPSWAKADSLDSYERLRAVPESGYEPDGRAGTSSTPNQSGFSTFSPVSRQGPPTRSGHPRRGSDNRISTVPEGDEDLDDHENYVLENQFENGERLLTPTQEAQRPNPGVFNTPPGGGEVGGPDTTPRTGERSRKHRSNGSSVFGIPKISRWSKTTSSSIQDNRSSSLPADRPSSEASRSGSEVNLIPSDGVYEANADDRLRSVDSLNNDAAFAGNGEQAVRSPPMPQASVIDNPKYQANRHSLVLEHPQPRQGPTPRHQTHLESQAYQYNVPMSPSSDTFGSIPSLARFGGQGYAGHRLSTGSGMGNLSPISSEGANSEDNGTQPKQYAPPRPPKIPENPPVPPKIPKTAEDVPMKDYAAGFPARYNYDEPDYAYNGDEGAAEPPAIQRKVSPYSPGALLAPIEERYSMEQERSVTPRGSPLPAIGARDAAVRKLTGPREMPGSTAKKNDVKRYSGDSETF